MPRDREAFFSITAYHLSEMATCDRKHVGALLVREGRIISTGYNGAPSGMPHCDHKDDEPCKRAVHAEANCIAFAAKYGITTEGSKLYTTLSPCYTCATLLINAGIKEVWFNERYRDPAGLQVLEEAGIRLGILSKPYLHFMSITYGDQPGVYPGQPPTKGPESRWSADSPDSGWGGAGWE